RLADYRDVFVHAVDGEHHSLQVLAFAQPERKALAAREDLPPRLAYLFQAGDASAVGMHAIDIVVVTPYRHHGFQVALGERILEPRFGVLRSREERLLYAGILGHSGNLSDVADQRSLGGCPTPLSRRGRQAVEGAYRLKALFY